MIFRKAEQEYQLGAVQSGPIKERLESHGLGHDKYQIQTKPGKGPFAVTDNPDLKPLGMGSERVVYYNPKTNKVEKYPHRGTTTSHSGDGRPPIRRTDFDKLIKSFERVMELRIFARVVNEYNNWYATKNPDKIAEIPYLAVPKSVVDENAVIHEPLLPEEKQGLKNTYKNELLKFFPKIKKDFFYFDPFGVGNAYSAGTVKSDDPLFHGRPRYHVIDGAVTLKESIINDPHLGQIFRRIEQEELQRTLNEIDRVFGGNKGNVVQ